MKIQTKHKVLAILSSISILLTACQNKNNHESIQTATNHTSYTVSKSQEKTYLVSDITIISVFNPEKGNTETYFMTLFSSEKKDTNKEITSSYFKESPLEEVILSTETLIENHYYEYQSIFDENIKYGLDRTVVTHSNYNGTFTSEYLQNGTNNFSVIDKQIKNGDESLDNFHTSFIINKNSNKIYRNDTYPYEYDINLTKFSEVFNYKDSDYIKASELKELLNTLNKIRSGYSLKKD